MLNSMMRNEDDNPIPNSKVDNNKPNDVGAIHVDGHIKIFDPETQEIYVESRA